MTVNAVTSQVTPKIEENSQIRTRTAAAGFDVLLARLGAVDTAARDASAQAVRSEPARRPAERALDTRNRAPVEAAKPREIRAREEEPVVETDNTTAARETDQLDHEQDRERLEPADDHTVERAERHPREHGHVTEEERVSDDGEVAAVQDFESAASPNAETKHAKVEHTESHAQDTADVPAEKAEITQNTSDVADAGAAKTIDSTNAQAAVASQVTSTAPVKQPIEVAAASSGEQVEAAAEAAVESIPESQSSGTPIVAKALAEEAEDAEDAQTHGDRPSNKTLESVAASQKGIAENPTAVASASIANASSSVTNATDTEVSAVNNSAPSKIAPANQPTANAAQFVSQAPGLESPAGAQGPAQAKAVLQSFHAVQAEQSPQTREQAGENANVSRVARGLQGAINQQGGSVTLRLAPPEIGFVRIDMDVKGGVAQVRLQAESETSTALLTQHLGTLKNAIESHGLTVERLDVRTMDSNPLNAFSQERSDLAFGDGRSRGQFSEQRGGSAPQPAVSGANGDDDVIDFQQAMVDAVG